MAVGNLVNIWAIGPVLFLSFTSFAVFFNFLWKGGVGSRIAGLVFSTISWLMASTPSYYVYAYDNFTMIYNSNYLVPQPGALVNGVADPGTWYYLLFVFGVFNMLFASLRLVFTALGAKYEAGIEED